MIGWCEVGYRIHSSSSALVCVEGIFVKTLESYFQSLHDHLSPHDHWPHVHYTQSTCRLISLLLGFPLGGTKRPASHPNPCAFFQMQVYLFSVSADAAFRRAITNIAISRQCFVHGKPLHGSELSIKFKLLRCMWRTPRWVRFLFEWISAFETPTGFHSLFVAFPVNVTCWLPLDCSNILHRRASDACAILQATRTTENFSVCRLVFAISKRARNAHRRESLKFN